MKITLVTASFNDLVHGTFNDKKTGCGINLLKPDTASRFHRGSDMTYLGEITCEKCKAKIAKEMIKADSKEMKALLKEEKLRAKRGLEDEGLVNLSELEQRPVSRYVEPRKPSNPPPVNDVQTNQNNNTYTNSPAPQNESVPPVAETQEDDFLKQFSIQKPETPQFEEEKPQEDDFLKQFTIQKPETSQFEEEKPQEDDFLSQFSISPEPQNEYQPETPVQPPVIDDISDAISAMNNINTQPEPEDLNNDILSMFAIDSSQATAEINTDYNSYDDDESIFDSMSSDDITENSGTNEWDIIANQLFADTSGNVNQSQQAFDDISVPEIEDIVSPELDDISAPEIEDIKIPSLDDISIDDIIAPAQSTASPIAEQPQAMTPPPVQPMTPPPVQPMTPPPVQPMTPPPVQPMTPPPIQQKNQPRHQQYAHK
ncbi:MAG: hypothetical protein K2K91_09210, partial [Ruminococcus sp.]|nr:hypothetical protein [Ruminococcus sp.]